MRAQLSSSKPTSPSVGVLDSGVGGLSVLREIQRQLPDIPTVYYADQAHLPYGPQPADQLRLYVRAIAEFLIAQGAVMIVLACHSASAASLDDLRALYPHIPIVGIEPAVKPAAEATKSGVIGVLTTQATADGTLYRRVVARYATNVRVITQVAPKLVTMVEQGGHDEAILREYVDPLMNAGTDQIVLACTHFPFLKADLEQITDAALVDPGAAVARQVGRVLPNVPFSGGINRYYTSGSPEAFQTMLKRLIDVGAEVASP
ncbi:MAG TPA: glutamate racemase [Phototrophicaceae bacterium]|nr:glutamate racemase [Phototrophicaceae bacterium]